MSDSPYLPPAHASKASVHANASSVEVPSLLPFAQLGLRLLGIMLVVDGVGAMFGGLVQGLLQAQAYSDAGYPVPIDPHSAGWMAGGIPHLIAGVYLIIGGEWVLINVFSSSRQSQSDGTENTDELASTTTD